MRVMLCTLVLNEMEWLEKLVEQHKDWPGLVRWVFVEGSDPIYRESNPGAVSDGMKLSTDGTTEFLRDLCQRTDAFIQHCRVQVERYPSADAAQYKCDLRNAYLQTAETMKPDLLVILDADEFYTREDQQLINDIVERCPKSNAWRLRQREIWRPPFLQVDEIPGGVPGFPLLSYEVTGGYWDMVHTRFFRWEPGLRYVDNHNWPTNRKGEYQLHAQVKLENGIVVTTDVGTISRVPQCVHLGFASKNRKAKTDYYVARGEGIRDDRQVKINCCRAWETWRPGDTLPHGAKVIPYQGPVPECFR